MKYMVVVNKKFIVSVEAISAGGAEHVILDRFSGIRGAQAFTAEELKTDTFAYYFAHCETISLNELEKLSDAYEAEYHKLSVALDKRDEIEAQIAELKLKMAELKNKLEIAQEDIRCCHDTIAIAEIDLGAKERAIA